MNPKIALRPSNVEGRGLIASARIQEGEKLLIWGGKSYTNRAGLQRALEQGKPFMQWDEDVFSFDVDEEVDETPFLINHSCDPNSWMADAFTVTARRDIAAGEEITADYALWECDPEYVSAWECNCKSKSCRKRITGKDWQLPRLQELYRGHFSPLINKRIRGLP